jgi:class 3 adenylate cyclase
VPNAHRPILALTGDLLEAGHPDLGALDTAVRHWERQVSGGDDREVCLALLWLAATRLQFYRISGAVHSLAHLRTRSRGRFRDLETLANFLEVRVHLESHGYRTGSALLDRLRPDLDDPRAAARLKAIRHYLRGEYLSAIGQVAVSFDEYVAALDTLKGGPAEREDLAITAEVYNAQGFSYLRWGRLDEATQAFSRAGTAAEHIGFVLAQARSLRGKGAVFSDRRQIREASGLLRQALQIYQQVRSPFGILRTCLALGKAHYLIRDYVQAMVYFEEARVQCGEGRFPNEEAEVAARMGDILVAQGRYGEAADFYEQDLQISTTSGSDRTRAHALRNVGRAQRLVRNYPRAELCLDEARGLYARLNDADGLCQTLVQLIMCYTEQGKATQAREALESLKSSVAGMGRPLEQGLAGLLEGMVLRREGHTDLARQHLEAALTQLAAEPGFYTVLAQIELASALGDAGQGQRGADHLKEAVTLARSLALHDMERTALDLLARVDRAEWARLAHEPRPLAQAAAAGQEKAYVSVLMLELRGLSYQAEPTPLGRALDAWFDALGRGVAEHGGVVSRVVGTRAVCLFGLASPCDPLQALGCARQVAEATARLRLGEGDGPRASAAAALATGEVLQGLFGPGDRREFSVVGAPLELASTLLAHARGGEILVCPVSFQTLGPHVSHPYPREIQTPEGQRLVAYQVASSAAVLPR